MKNKAMKVLRDYVGWYYTYYFAKPRNDADIRECRAELSAVYDTLEALGLVTIDEYKATKKEVRHEMRKEVTE